LCAGQKSLTLAVIVHRVLELTDITSYGALCVLHGTDSSNYGVSFVLELTAAVMMYLVLGGTY